MKRISITFVLAALVLACPARSQEEQVKLFQLGQSYRTPMDMVKAFAEVRGHDMQVKAYLPPGVPIHAHWSKMERSKGIVADSDCNVLCLVPYYDFNENSPAAAAGFFGLVLEKNPDARAYLVDHWPNRAMPMEEKEAWIEENLPRFEAMAAEANRQHPDAKHPMQVVPRAAAFMDLLRYCDRIPGFIYPATAYNDGGHQSNTSNYMFACMEYAWIYGESPLGLPNRAEVTRKGVVETLFDLTEQQALALQRLGWHHLAAHPTSGVTLPADDQAPPAPADVTAEATPHAVTLTWPELLDAGTGTFKYLVRRSDGFATDNLVGHLVDGAVTSGRTYEYAVVAVDFAGNESPASAPVKVAVPVDRQAPKIASVAADRTAETVRVVFDEAVDPETAARAESYSIEGLPVLGARMAGPDTVVLTTGPMAKGRRYALSVAGVRDVAPQPNTATASADFTFDPPAWKPFEVGEWEGTQVEIEGPQVRVTARGEGGFRNAGEGENPAMAGIVRTVEGDFDIPLAITSQGQVAATTGLKPYQRKGNVKTGFIIAEDILNVGKGNFAVFYLDDSTRFRMVVHRDWLVTARVIGAGLSAGDPRKNRDGLNLPVWLRFVREGTLLTGYYSLEGVADDQWVKLGSINAAKMPDKVQLGIFNMSGVADEHSTAMFDLRASGNEKSYTNIGE